MKGIARMFLLVVICLPMVVFAGDGYRVTGKVGVNVFVAIDAAHKGNEDTYRFAATECGGKKVCKILYWVGNAPSGFPLTDAQVDSMLVQWQLNLNTDRRRWLVNCTSSNLFSKERVCM